MQTSIRLEISTGAGNRVVVAECGSINALYYPIYQIAFGGQYIGDLNNQNCRDVSLELVSVIDALRNQRALFESLTEPQQSYRIAALEYLIRLHDECRKHPDAVVVFTIWIYGVGGGF